MDAKEPWKHALRDYGSRKIFDQFWFPFSILEVGTTLGRWGYEYSQQQVVSDIKILEGNSFLPAFHVWLGRYTNEKDLI